MPSVLSKSSGEVDWKKVALIVAPVVTVGIVGYLYYRSRSSSSSTFGQTDHPRVLALKDADRILSDTDLSDLSPLERAIALKNRGNKYFKGGNYEKAVECYTQAIEGCPPENTKELSTFYQNRAAANENRRVVKSSIEDCSAALDLDPRYLKAMSRRARLYENEKRMKEALEDVTALCILEGFNNVESLQRADRVLKALGETLSKEEMPKKMHQLPSSAFLRTYFSSFCHDPFLNPPEPPDGHEEQNGDGMKHSPAEITLEKAIEKLVQGAYEEAADLSEKAVTELKSENHKRLPEGLLLRGSFRLLRGDTPGALEDMEGAASTDTAAAEVRTTALIRKGSLIMTTRSDIEQSLAEFARALNITKENSDVYHHRGQLYLICDKLDQAVADLNKAASLSPDFSIAQAQKAYASYRAAQSKQNIRDMQSAIQELQQLTEKYPRCIETHSLYSQVLVDLGRFDEADQHFEKIIALEPNSGTAYVHRGLLQLQWKQNVDGAIDLMKKAIKMDSRCEFAHETLATVYVQRGNFDEALMLFAKAIQLCRTEAEMAHLISLREAVVAQQRVCERLGLSVQDLIKQNMRSLHGHGMGGIPVPV